MVNDPIETRAGRDAERGDLLSLTVSMTAEQNKLMLLILGTLNNLDQQADHQAQALREHARPRVPGQHRELPHNPGRACLILDSLRAQRAIGSKQITGYLDAFRVSQPTPDPAIIARLEALEAATLAANHALHAELASHLPAAPSPAPVASDNLYPSDSLFPSTGKE